MAKLGDRKVQLVWWPEPTEQTTNYQVPLLGLPAMEEADLSFPLHLFQCLMTREQVLGTAEIPLPPLQSAHGR